MTAGKAVVVSGASTGIGEATVTVLAQSGFVVFAGVRNESDAARMRDVNPNVRPLLMDVTDASAIDNGLREVAQSRVPLAGVVSNAGIAVGGPLEYLPIDELRRQFEVNVFGALGLAQAFLPLLSAGGRIVFIGSISGRLATPYIGPYSASKFALRALADAFRVELAPAGIAVSLVEPGSVKTPIWRKGNATAGELAARLRPDVRAHYRLALDRMLALTESEDRDGMPAGIVAHAIHHALTAPKPRAQYLLGRRARIGSVIALLPAGLRDRALRASMRIP